MANKPKARTSQSSKTSASKTSASKAPASNTKLVRELADILNETNLTEIEMRKGDLEIRVSKNNAASTIMAAPVNTAAPLHAPAAQTAPAAVQSAAAVTDTPDSKPAANHPGAVKSPMVGTVYTRPSPDADSFVNVGDKVQEGDTIVLIEAMKTFNPITAPRSGKIEAVLVEDAQPVEFGETLFVIT